MMMLWEPGWLGSGFCSSKPAARFLYPLTLNGGSVAMTPARPRWLFELASAPYHLCFISNVDNTDSTCICMSNYIIVLTIYSSSHTGLQLSPASWDDLLAEQPDPTIIMVGEIQTKKIADNWVLQCSTRSYDSGALFVMSPHAVPSLPTDADAVPVYKDLNKRYRIARLRKLLRGLVAAPSSTSQYPRRGAVRSTSPSYPGHVAPAKSQASLARICQPFSCKSTIFIWEIPASLTW